MKTSISVTLTTEEVLKAITEFVSGKVAYNWNSPLRHGHAENLKDDFANEGSVQIGYKVDWVSDPPEEAPAPPKPEAMAKLVEECCEPKTEVTA